MTISCILWGRFAKTKEVSELLRDAGAAAFFFCAEDRNGETRRGDHASFTSKYNNLTEF